jgi:hypothetical protein
MADTIGSFIGSTVGEAAAFAAGLAIGPILAPLLRALENETWSEYPDMPLDAQTVAQGVAEGKIEATTGAAEALQTGFGPSAFALLVDLVKTGPGVAQGINLIRRGQLTAADFVTVLQRAGLEDQWVTAYQKLSTTQLEPWETPLSPADLALGLIRGNLQNFDAPDGPAFPAGGSTAGGLVPHDPVSTIDVKSEAAASGLDAERMAVLARNVGLPPGVIEGLQMLNRGIINEADFYLLIAQSDARLSWGPFLLKLKDAILSPHDYIQNRLRGWDTDVQNMYDGGALHGFSDTQMDVLYQIQGRPLSWHQVWIGLQRGGSYDGDISGIDPAFLKALEESDIRPEWYNLAWAQRYTLPGYFVLKALVPSPVSVAECTQILTESGWPPDLAAQTAQSFDTTASATTKPKALSDTTIRSAYKHETITEADALARLEANGYSAADAAIYLTA